MAEERKLATILFADLAGSTALADEQDPERTRARLERFYDAMAEEIQAAGGTIETFAGDAVMAAFGAPEALEDHAERALHVALSMQRRLEQSLALRVGVNTSTLRSGMWRQRPSHEVMDEWTTRALTGVVPESPEHVKALIARGFEVFIDSEESAARAMEMAEALGDAALTSSARDAAGVTAFRAGRFEEAYELESSRFDLRSELEDPDFVHDLYLSTIPAAAATGRLQESRELARELVDVVADLTPHHRLHAAAILIEGDELQGTWEGVIAREQATVDAVEQNRDTPCVRNARSLLLCALARELHGDSGRSAELEAYADDLHLEGHGVATLVPRARLAIARGQVDLLEGLFADFDWRTRQSWFILPAAAARLDALSIFGTASDIEEAFAPPASYLEPFVLRALGLARSDNDLLSQADNLFRALALDWHADQTPHLAELRKLTLS